MSKIRLSVKDIKDIQIVMKKFPDVESFQLHEHGNSGIGYLLDMEFETEINGIKCKVAVPIIDESMW